jgi:hypothetical protein
VVIHDHGGETGYGIGRRRRVSLDDCGHRSSFSLGGLMRWLGSRAWKLM